jgi:hypothetical protein
MNHDLENETHMVGIFYPRYLRVAGRQFDAIFHNDILPILFLLACGFTNGFFVSLAMMQSQTYSASLSVDQKALAGALVFFALSTGLTLGSMISFLVQAWLQHHYHHRHHST